MHADTVETRYYWYIPKHNEIIQSEGTFKSTGVFDSREKAIAFIKQAELSVPPDEVFLVEAETTEWEEAAVHVGAKWQGSKSQAADGEGISPEDVEMIFDEWDDYDIRTVLNTLESIAKHEPILLFEYLLPLVKQYNQATDRQQRDFDTIFTHISETDTEQLDKQLTPILEQFESTPTGDTAKALVTLLPLDSSQTDAVVDDLISAIAEETLTYETRLAIAEQLETLVTTDQVSRETILTTLQDHTTLETKLLGIAGLNMCVPSVFDIPALLEQLDSDDQAKRRASVEIIETCITLDSGESLSEETLGALQTALVADWTTNQMETRDSARHIIAVTAEQFPEGIGEITTELIEDIRATLNWVPDDPGYGVTQITEYGTMAATALGRYLATTDSVPSELVSLLAKRDRRKRGHYLATKIVNGCPAVIDELVQYGLQHPESQDIVCERLGHIAGSDANGSIRAWQYLIDGTTSNDGIRRSDYLTGVKTATFSDSSYITDITYFLDEVPNVYEYKRDLAAILSNVAKDDPTAVTELWGYIEEPNLDESNNSQSKQIIAANALSGVAKSNPEYFDDIDRCLTQALSDEEDIAASFASVINSVWGDQPEALKSIYPDLMEKFNPEADRSFLIPLVKISLTVAKSEPEYIDAKKFRQLTTHDLNQVRTDSYDILGYAGPPEVYSHLKERLEAEDREQICHTITHACTRLEVRFPDQIEREDESSSAG